MSNIILLDRKFFKLIFALVNCPSCLLNLKTGTQTQDFILMLVLTTRQYELFS